LRTYFLEGATGARFEQIRLAPGQQSIPALTHPQALAVCSAGNWYGGGDSRTFRLEEQWEWLNPGKHLSLATTIRGEVACLLADCWLQFLPESPSTSEFWLVRDGLLLGPLPLVQAPPGCRVIATAPQLPIESDQMTIKSEEGLAELQTQLNEKIHRLYTTVKTD